MISNYLLNIYLSSHRQTVPSVLIREASHCDKQWRKLKTQSGTGHFLPHPLLRFREHHRRGKRKYGAMLWAWQSQDYEMPHVVSLAQPMQSRAHSHSDYMQSTVIPGFWGLMGPYSSLQNYWQWWILERVNHSLQLYTQWKFPNSWSQWQSWLNFTNDRRGFGGVIGMGGD